MVVAPLLLISSPKGCVGSAYFEPKRVSLDLPIFSPERVHLVADFSTQQGVFCVWFFCTKASILLLIFLHKRMHLVADFSTQKVHLVADFSAQKGCLVLHIFSNQERFVQLIFSPSRAFGLRIFCPERVFGSTNCVVWNLPIWFGSFSEPREYIWYTQC